MKKVALLIPWSADIGHGILLTILMLVLWGIDPQWVYFLMGIIFSVIPDIDAVKEFLTFGDIAASAGRLSDHRDTFHFPLVWLVFGLIFIWFNHFFGLLFLFAVMLHFLNDSWGTGWGIKWLWPFINKNYKFFSRNDRDGDVTLKQLVVSWTPEEKINVMKKKWNPQWLRDIYLTPTKISVIEIGTFVFSLIVLALFLFIVCLK